MVIWNTVTLLARAVPLSHLQAFGYHTYAGGRKYPRTGILGVLGLIKNVSVLPYYHITPPLPQCSTGNAVSYVLE